MKDSYFLSQPHQPFFLLTIINAVVFMGLFVLAYEGIVFLEFPNAFFHLYSFAYGVFFLAFSGFLFTTFPRFNQTAVIEKKYYTNVFSLSVLGSVFLYLGVFFGKYVFLSGMTVLFLAQGMMVYRLYDIYNSSQVREKSDSFWILCGNVFGLFAHLLFLLYVAGVDVVFDIAVSISVIMFLLFTTFSVAQRMVPFFSHSFAPKDDKFVRNAFVLFLLVSISNATHILIAESLLTLILSFVLAKEFYRWKLDPLNSPAILWVLHLSLYWLAFGFFLWGVFDILSLISGVDFYFIGYHFVLLGFLTTILLGFGTRVILGHSRNVPHADKVSIALFILIQVALVFRALYSLSIANDWGADLFFTIASYIWIGVFIVWGIKFFKVLVYR